MLAVFLRGDAMTTCAKEIVPFDRVRETPARLGFWAASLTAAVTIVSFGIAIFTPPRSGPFCMGACAGYPYSDTAAFFPRDYLWIFPAILLTPLFLVVCVCAHSWVATKMRVFSGIALMFAAIATGLITLDYFIQIEVMQPSLLKGETDGIALFSQYNPHGIFIAMEDLGYLMMSAAFFFLGAALGADSRLERIVRWLLMVSSALAYASFVGMSIAFGNALETRFELAIITINWTALIIVSVMLSILFRRTLRHPAS
jgi:hypothetical protein